MYFLLELFFPPAETSTMKCLLVKKIRDNFSSFLFHSGSFSVGQSSRAMMYVTLYKKKGSRGKGKFHKLLFNRLLLAMACVTTHILSPTKKIFSWYSPLFLCMASYLDQNGWSHLFIYVMKGKWE